MGRCRSAGSLGFAAGRGSTSSGTIAHLLHHGRAGLGRAGGVIRLRDRPEPGGCYGKSPSRQTGSEMRWRVLVELAGANGAVEVHEVGVGEHPPAGPRRKAPQVLDGLLKVLLD